MNRQIAIYGGSFNPPGVHHRSTALMLCRHFDEVVIVPCGPRPDKPVTNSVEPIYRAAMVDLSFRGIPKARVDLFDLESSTFTRTYELDRRFKSEGTVWHVVADEFVRGGQGNESHIQREWTRGKRALERSELRDPEPFRPAAGSGGPSSKASCLRDRTGRIERDNSQSGLSSASRSATWWLPRSTPTSAGIGCIRE